MNNELKGILDSETAKKVDSFLRTKGKRFLFFHADPDGVTSAALIKKYYGDFNLIDLPGPRIEEEMLRDVMNVEPSLIVFVDLPVDHYSNIDDLVEMGGVRIVIIDHHIPQRDMSSENVIHFNPMFRKKVYMPASYLVYHILENAGLDVRDSSWISAIGVIADYGFSGCDDIFETCENMNPGTTKSDKHITDSMIGKATSFISSAIILKGADGIYKALEILLKSKNPQDILKNRILSKWDEEVRGEIDNEVRRFEREKMIFEDLKLITFTAKSKAKITSIISTVISEKYPDYVVIVRKKADDDVSWKLSIRSQGNPVNVADMTKECSKDLGDGGGHENAAGAFIRDWEEFKSRVVTYLRDFHSKHP